MRPGITWLVGGTLGFVLLLLLAPGLAQLLPLLWLCLSGWVGFVQRVMPNVHLNWNGIGMMALCSLLIVAGTQLLGTWWTNSRAESVRPVTPTATAIPAASAVGPRWRWGWSVCVYCSLWLLFLSAMGITGLAHQLGWLLTSGQPIYVTREFRGDWVRQLKEKGWELSLAADEEHWDLAATRNRFYAEQNPPHPRRPHALEAMHVLFLGNRDGQLVAAIAFHRDETKRHLGFLLVTREAPSEIKPMKELPLVLARYDTKQ